MSKFEIENGILKKCIEADETVMVPIGVTEIGPKAFYENSDVYDVVLPITVKSIGIKAFGNCEHLENVIMMGVEKIGGRAFENCGRLIRAALPAKLRVISQACFENCSRLRTVNFPYGLERIEDFAFIGCGELTDICIPDTVKYIGVNAFAICEGLETVRLPSDCDLGEGAFAGCENLCDGNDMTIFNGVVFGVFRDDEEIIIPRGIKTISADAFSDISQVKKIVLPDGLETIGSGAFWHCRVLKEINLPDSLVRIDSLAFSHCRELKIECLPPDLRYIGNYSFAECGKIGALTIPKSVEYIGELAFSLCSSLDHLYIEGTPEISEILAAGSPTIIVAPKLPYSKFTSPAMRLAAALGYAESVGRGGPDYGENGKDYRKYIHPRNIRKRLFPWAKKNIHIARYLFVNEKLDREEIDSFLSDPDTAAEIKAMAIEYAPKDDVWSI